MQEPHSRGLVEVRVPDVDFVGVGRGHGCEYESTAQSADSEGATRSAISVLERKLVLIVREGSHENVSVLARVEILRFHVQSFE